MGSCDPAVPRLSTWSTTSLTVDFNSQTISMIAVILCDWCHNLSEWWLMLWFLYSAYVTGVYLLTCLITICLSVFIAVSDLPNRYLTQPMHAFRPLGGRRCLLRNVYLQKRYLCEKLGVKKRGEHYPVFHLLSVSRLVMGGDDINCIKSLVHTCTYYSTKPKSM